MQATGIPATELAARRKRLLEHARANGLTGVVLFDQAYIQYFTSFSFLSTERPVAWAQNTSGDMVAFVPEFEVERTRAETSFERVESYPEYPGTEHPMTIWARVLADMGIRDRIGADNDGYPGILGYQGPALSEVTGQPVPTTLACTSAQNCAEFSMPSESRTNEQSGLPVGLPLRCVTAAAMP